jgi:hypothetical protein
MMGLMFELHSPLISGSGVENLKNRLLIYCDYFFIMYYDELKWFDPIATIFVGNLKRELSCSIYYIVKFNLNFPFLILYC